MVQFGTLVNVLGQADMGDSAPVRGMIHTSNGQFEAYVKRVIHEDRLAAELFAFLIARSVGLPVPDAVVVSIPPAFGPHPIGFGSIAINHPNLFQGMRSYSPTARSLLRAWPKVIDAVCFDEWIGNSDRHPGNVLSDGNGNFWLIDHDKAILAELMQPDALSFFNELFNAVDSGKFGPERDEYRRKVEETMSIYQSIGLNGVLANAGGIQQANGVPEMADWLGMRQSHLLKLGCERVPVQQMGIFP